MEGDGKRKKNDQDYTKNWKKKLLNKLNNETNTK